MFIPLFGKVLLIPGGAGFRPSTVVILPSKRNLSCKAFLGDAILALGIAEEGL